MYQINITYFREGSTISGMFVGNREEIKTFFINLLNETKYKTWPYTGDIQIVFSYYKENYFSYYLQFNVNNNINIKTIFKVLIWIVLQNNTHLLFEFITISKDNKILKEGVEILFKN